MGVARWPRGEAGGVQPVAGRFESFPRLLRGEEHEQSCALLGQESWSTARTAAAAPHRPKDPARERRYRRDRERPVLGWLWEDLELLALARSSSGREFWPERTRIRIRRERHPHRRRMGVTFTNPGIKNTGVFLRKKKRSGDWPKRSCSLVETPYKIVIEV